MNTNHEESVVENMTIAAARVFFLAIDNGCTENDCELFKLLSKSITLLGITNKCIEYITHTDCMPKLLLSKFVDILRETKNLHDSYLLKHGGDIYVPSSGSSNTNSFSKS
jgi:hypothetical protein